MGSECVFRDEVEFGGCEFGYDLFEHFVLSYLDK